MSLPIIREYWAGSPRPPQYGLAYWSIDKQSARWGSGSMKRPLNDWSHTLYPRPHH